jgi:hypothetical protein
MPASAPTNQTFKMRYERAKTYAGGDRSKRDRGGLHSTHAAARVAVYSTEFAGITAAVIEPHAAEHAEYRSECSAGVSETEYGRLLARRQTVTAGEQEACGAWDPARQSWL